LEKEGEFSEAGHRRFVENELLGIDVMPFAANVAAYHVAYLGVFGPPLYCRWHNNHVPFVCALAHAILLLFMYTAHLHIPQIYPDIFAPDGKMYQNEARQRQRHLHFLGYPQYPHGFIIYYRLALKGIASHFTMRI